MYLNMYLGKYLNQNHTPGPLAALLKKWRLLTDEYIQLKIYVYMECLSKKSNDISRKIIVEPVPVVFFSDQEPTL